MPRPRSQSALRAPLNRILGTEANVRLLRVLSLARTSLASGELARRAGLGRTGVYPALASLEVAGIIEYVGVGAQRQVRFRNEHPLASAIANLFEAESGRLHALVEELRSLFRHPLPQPVLSAWLDGSSLTERALEEPGEGADSISCYIVAEPKALPSVTEAVRAQLSDLEQRFEISVDVVGVTRSEVAMRIKASAFRDPVLLAGIPPLALIEKAKTGAARDLRNRLLHAHHDDGALRLAQAIAFKLQQDPSRQQAARAQVEKRLHSASKQEQLELKEWLRLLSMPRAKLRRFLVDSGPRATRLRQSLPALGLLTPQERDAVLMARSEEEVRTIVARRDSRQQP